MGNKTNSMKKSNRIKRKMKHPYSIIKLRNCINKSLDAIQMNIENIIFINKLRIIMCQRDKATKLEYLNSMADYCKNDKEKEHLLNDLIQQLNEK